jgi:hypothetical protein
LAATVTQRWVTTPGPVRSASVTVSPAMGRQLSSFDSGSGLLLDARRALKSLSVVRSPGSTRGGGDCARTAAPSSAGIHIIAMGGTRAESIWRKS